MITVRVPATAANLGPGFDACGLALDWYDEMSVEQIDGDHRAEVTGEGADEVPTDASHLVIKSILQGLDSLQSRVSGVLLRTHNTIPHGRGLGSSAAAIVGGLALAHALAKPGVDLDRQWLLEQSAAAEGHPDNVAATVRGGFTIAWTDDAAATAVSLAPHPDLGVLALVPDHLLPTERARSMLPSTVPHADAAATAGRAALLTHAVTTDPDLLLAATRDWLHQTQRGPALGESYSLLTELRREGWAAVVSGAGPTVLVLGRHEALRDLAGRRFHRHRAHLHVPGSGVRVRTG
ncbi:homoserine kinase [Propionibacteriaceae bacterium Y1700]|uniref:homoserine kinase n=1 Tax=Microlunatus sp. Y1700 TaxID=3418487 RepID=UPI003DA7057C